MHYTVSQKPSLVTAGSPHNNSTLSEDWMRVTRSYQICPILGLKLQRNAWKHGCACWASECMLYEACMRLHSSVWQKSDAFICRDKKITLENDENISARV